MADAKRPFDRNYVIRTTAKHMLDDVDRSIRKTIERIPEFEGDGLKSTEIMMTLSDLHSMKKQLSESLGEK